MSASGENRRHLHTIKAALTSGTSHTSTEMNAQQNDHQLAESLQEAPQVDDGGEQETGVASTEAVDESLDQCTRDHVSSDADEEDTSYEFLPTLLRPRKKVFLSTLRKRDREKKRRDNFNQGLERLAGKLDNLKSNPRKHNFTYFLSLSFSELVFQVDPTISSGREAHITKDAKGTTITNRSELMQSAVDAMSALIRQHSQQQETIRKLTEALQEANTKCRLLQERANAVVIDSRHTPSGGRPVDGDRVSGLHDLLGLIDSAAASQRQGFTAGISGSARSGVGFNLVGIMDRGPPHRPATLEELLSEAGNRTNPDIFAGRSDIFLRNSYLLQQQRASAFQSTPVNTAMSPSVSDPSFGGMDRHDPSAYAFLQQFVRASGGVDRYEGHGVGAATRSSPEQVEDVPIPKSRRRKRDDDERYQK